jgi:hypothetical protein
LVAALYAATEASGTYIFVIILIPEKALAVNVGGVVACI